MLHKIYGSDPVGEKRYSPAICIGAQKRKITGEPDAKHISTSYAERANLTMRMHMRRFTRLTNAFSKKVENHVAAVALHTMFYNFVRVHQTLKVSPAMAAGVTDKLWEISAIWCKYWKIGKRSKIANRFSTLTRTRSDGKPFVRVTFPDGKDGNDLRLQYSRRGD